MCVCLSWFLSMNQSGVLENTEESLLLLVQVMEFTKIPGMECIYLDIEITLKFQIQKLGSV